MAGHRHSLLEGGRERRRGKGGREGREKKKTFTIKQ